MNNEINLAKNVEKYFDKNRKLRRIEKLFDKGDNLNKLNYKLLEFYQNFLIKTLSSLKTNLIQSQVVVTALKLITMVFLFLKKQL